jgi:putative transposase
MDVGLRTLKLRQLRLAIQRNTISFPSPTPVFDWRQDNDVQWRMAHLFFIAGWSILALGRRYQVPSSRAGMLVRDWIELAIASGLVQEIPPEPQTSSSGEKTIVEFRRQRIPASGLSAPAANEGSRGARRRKHYTDAEIATILKDAGHSRKNVPEICRALGIAPRTFNAWKSKFGGMSESGIRELRRLRDENRKLRKWSIAVTLMLAGSTANHK